jgi:hypothetical protein
MFTELVNTASEVYKCDCLDVFFDLLCPELNIEGFVFFYKHLFPPIPDYLKLVCNDLAIQKHFQPAE